MNGYLWAGLILGAVASGAIPLDYFFNPWWGRKALSRPEERKHPRIG